MQRKWLKLGFCYKIRVIHDNEATQETWLLFNVDSCTLTLIYPFSFSSWKTSMSGVIFMLPSKLP